MNPRNPSVIEAREANSEYIIYYSQIPKSEIWQMERVSDGEIVASGSLEAMLSLLTLFPNSRRASWAEDMQRYKPSVFYANYNFDDIFTKTLKSLGGEKVEMGLIDLPENPTIHPCKIDFEKLMKRHTDK